VQDVAAAARRERDGAVAAADAAEVCVPSTFGVPINPSPINLKSWALYL